MRTKAFTLMDLIFCIAVAGLILCILLPILEMRKVRRGGPGQMPNSVRVRGIQSGLVLWAAGNNGYYPGLDRYGKPIAGYDQTDPLTVEARLLALIEENYFGFDYVVSPNEIKPVFDGAGEFTSKNYSYALTALTGNGSRVGEWSETSNPEAVVVSDRAIGTNQGVRSIFTEQHTGPSIWWGSVGHNDNHVTFETTHIKQTKYLDNQFMADNLFVAGSDDDAAMAYKGTSDLIETRDEK